eukprot:TRINITY_DN1830_c0_g1_i5.p1 TRINITY_DN1830_c0_g1~~TRINITY_DN1830_c0_g1_i5.p1  ORF type:complete len:150 (-),score=19.82 TRINITY_DN1830_c0_g1_i5:106-555(-)
MNGHTQTSTLLLELGVGMNTAMTERSHHTPLTIAAFSGHTAAYDLLLAYGANPTYRALPWDEEPWRTAGGTPSELWAQRAECMAAAPEALVCAEKHEHEVVKATVQRLMEEKGYDHMFCDVCSKDARDWVYHCDQCGWDAHFSCVGVNI